MAGVVTESVRDQARKQTQHAGMADSVVIQWAQSGFYGSGK